MSRSILAAVFTFALVALPQARADGPAPAPTPAKAPAPRVYFTEGGSMSQKCRVEQTAEGTAVVCESRVVLGSRPMSQLEQAMRLEWIRGLDLGDGKATALTPQRREVIERILDRTNPMNVVRPVEAALRSGFEAWTSPLRFEAMWVNHNHPPARD